LEDAIEQGRSHPKQRRYKVTVHHLPALKRRKPACEEEKTIQTLTGQVPSPVADSKRLTKEDVFIKL
jgi:hypothetical protein